MRAIIAGLALTVAAFALVGAGAVLLMENDWTAAIGLAVISAMGWIVLYLVGVNNRLDKLERFTVFGPQIPCRHCGEDIAVADFGLHEGLCAS